MTTVKVNLSAAFRNAAKLLKSKRRVTKALRAAAVEYRGVTIPEIKKHVPVRDGGLQRSIQGEVRGRKADSVTVRFFSRKVYGGIRDQGGRIAAKRAAALAIPLQGQRMSSPREDGELFVKKIRGDGYLMRRLGNGRLEPRWLLKKAVVQRGSGFMRKGIEDTLPQLPEIVAREVTRTIEGAFGEAMKKARTS